MASTAMAVAGLVAPTMTPPMAAPPITVAFWPSRSRLLASCRSSTGTSCGMTPCEDG